MSTPYGPPGSEEPTQGGHQPPGPGVPGAPVGGVPAQDPAPGYPQPAYTPPAYPYPGQGHPQPAHVPQDLYRQAAPAGRPYGQQQSWPPGYQAYPPAGPPPRSADPDQPVRGGSGRRSALPWILSGLAAAVLLGMVLVLGFVSPGYFTTTVFDQDAVQQGVQRILSDEYGQQAESVTCPADQEVRPGSTFSCQATIDGVQRNVTITVRTRAGEYEVARPN